MALVNEKSSHIFKQYFEATVKLKFLIKVKGKKFFKRNS